MAVTVRQALNRVLTAIGESSIDVLATSVTGTLPLKLLEFLNQFKEEIEDANTWRALRTQVTVTVLANTNNVAIPNADERARVVRVPEPQAGMLLPLVFDVNNPQNPIALVEIPLAELLYRANTEGAGQTVQEPTYFAVDVQADAAILYVYPMPNVNRTVSLYMYIPQAVLAAADLDTAIKIPSLPLMKGVIWYALTDRGEEMGANSAFTEERYRTSVDDAISRDSAEQGTNDQLVVV